MKTRDAFAFRNFDYTKILSRRFFKEIFWEFYLGSDTEVLAKLDHSVWDFRQAEKSQRRLLEILCYSMKYVIHIKRHIIRLHKIQLQLANKIVEGDKDGKITAQYDRAKNLVDRYKRIEISCTVLEERIIALRDENEKEIEKEYRVRLAKHLRAGRLRLNLSQGQFAEKAEIAQSEISRYEGGRKSPNLRTLAKLASTLEITIDELIYGGTQ